MKNHIAIYISNNDDKLLLIERIVSGDILVDLKGLNHALFSEITLNKFIEEEIVHGHFDVVTETKNSLLQSSEGERKKALLDYIILQNPDYIIADNVFGNLDVEKQAVIKETFTKLSNKTTIVQITNRKEDILSFVHKTYKLQAGVLVEFNQIESSKTTNSITFVEGLPQPYRPISEHINPLVKFNKVSVTYNERPIITDISWEIKQGEFWQLMGANGSGKSTMLSMIFGDNPKAYGQDITLFGIKKGSGESVWDIKRKIGYFSSEMLRGFKRLDSIANMIVSGFFDSVGLYKEPTNEQIKITEQWLHVLQMYTIRKQNFLELSRGHQRLVLIARAMVKHPPLLILDEPTNGLDDFDAKLFTELINKIATETDTAILYVSHRKEAGLNPDFIFELRPSGMGSIGKQIK
ncbi:putative ABC transporter ATP-binding protein YlmA [Mariniflexile rhizosphaerae]|uniref:ATP-binding cassette domain-containing protein n=1 Tax=unclassified Mariniflexile TaxID=2643887 RepID=UPI000CC8E7FF|nr:ATP-binding cassette domain-containing protein [Mariniflexile sp. TRM1-10]AXP82837.1 putative ABC transporter ATP-binding protein YlmA [Mariniflexile sp. TRM1-10]PLB19096.1 MAG: ABC transporter [Flavobacteriaceae bacterium FS1-H7996/R]